MPKLTDAMNSIRTCGRKSINLKDKPLMKPAPTALRDYVRNTKARGEGKVRTSVLSLHSKVIELAESVTFTYF